MDSNETKHTPGPWKCNKYVVDRDGKTERVRIVAGDISTGSIIADMVAGSPADALLIAAAPEMYQALVDLDTVTRPTPDVTEEEAESLGVRYGHENGTWSEIVHAIRGRVRAIIAKAEGK